MTCETTLLPARAEAIRLPRKKPHIRSIGVWPRTYACTAADDRKVGLGRTPMVAWLRWRFED